LTEKEDHSSEVYYFFNPRLWQSPIVFIWKRLPAVL